MKNSRILIIITMLVSLMLACNISMGDTPPSPTPVVIVVTQLVIADTATPQPEEPIETPNPLPSEPSELPTLVATSTASAPMVTPLKDPVNCRFGPSVSYAQISALNVGAYMPIIGKTADRSWWQVLIPDSNNQACWVGATVTTTTGELSGVPTVPAPEAFITNVQLTMKPNSINLGPDCAVGPFPTFAVNGTISTNGPLEIRWYIETQQDGRLPEKTIKVPQYGAHNVSFTFVPSVWKKGNFWIRIVITKPQSMVSDTTYQVKCQ